jgi:hypothetical protein
MSEYFKCKNEQDSSITSVSLQSDDMCDENEVFLQNLFDVVFNDGEKILENLSKKIYPELKYKVINYGIKYDIYTKEPEDFECIYNGIDGKFDYLTQLDDSLIIDGNKLNIYGVWINGINDKINFLILNYQIDILIIRNSYWNQPINNLPNRILSIKIYSDLFNQPVCYLPSELKILCIKSDYLSDADEHHNDDNIGGMFDQDINNLPPNLEELVISSKCFNKPIDNLPINLKRLYIEGCDGDFDQSVNNLPNNLKILLIGSPCFEQELNNLPESLEILYIEFLIDLPDILENLPQGLKTLYYGLGDFGNRDSIYSYTVNNLPNNITNLYLGSFNNTIDYLPDSIEKLYIYSPECWSKKYNEFDTVINKLPQNLKSLYIDGKNIKYVDKHIIDTICKCANCNNNCILFTCDKKKFTDIYIKDKIHPNSAINWKEIGYQMTCV